MITAVRLTIILNISVSLALDHPFLCTVGRFLCTVDKVEKTDIYLCYLGSRSLHNLMPAASVKIHLKSSSESLREEGSVINRPYV